MQLNCDNGLSSISVGCRKSGHVGEVLCIKRWAWLWEVR